MATVHHFKCQIIQLVFLKNFSNETLMFNTKPKNREQSSVLETKAWAFGLHVKIYIYGNKNTSDNPGVYYLLKMVFFIYFFHHFEVLKCMYFLNKTCLFGLKICV